jgi:hypothetical protein
MTMENGSTQLPELSGRTRENAESSSEVPQGSAEFRTMPKDAEDFGKVPQVAERCGNHTLTVRETARMFETAGVARTERSIINWCQPNRQGIMRLDSYYDPNERKYYITPQSVEAVIQEEIQRAKRLTASISSEGFGTPVAHVKHLTNEQMTPSDGRKIQELEREISDLKINNRVKDHFIELLKDERHGLIEQLQTTSRSVGQLESKLHQLDGPKM